MESLKTLLNPFLNQIEKHITQNQTLTKSSYDENQYVCERCGKTVEPVKLGEFWYKAQCECVRREIEEANLKKLKQQQLQRMIEKFTSANPRLKDYTFSNFKVREGAEKAYKYAKRYSETFKDRLQEGKGLLIYGQPGNGKSHLAGAITNEIITQGYSVVYEAVPMLLERIKSTYSSNEGENINQIEILGTLSECDLLILDDLGAEKWTPWVEQTLFIVINNRYNNRKPMVITTNVDIKALENAVGYRNFDRLVEMCVVVENSATSYRREIAKQRR